MERREGKAERKASKKIKVINNVRKKCIDVRQRERNECKKEKWKRCKEGRLLGNKRMNEKLFISGINEE